MTALADKFAGLIGAFHVTSPIPKAAGLIGKYIVKVK